MKKTTTIAALSIAAILGATPLLASADDDYGRGDCDDRYENRHHGKSMGSDLKQYSTDEMRIMAYGQALRRFGPGVDVSVEELSWVSIRAVRRSRKPSPIGRSLPSRQYCANLTAMPARSGADHTLADMSGI